MDYSDERINYDDILKAEMSKVFPIFRWTNPAKIFTIVVLVLSTLVPVISAIIDGARYGGFYGRAEVFSAIFALGIQCIWLWIIYKLYTLDRMDIFWIWFAIGIVLDIFFAGNYLSAIFKIWLALAVFNTKKAVNEANRIHRDLSEARKYSQEKEMRKKLADPETYRNQVAEENASISIDNSNMFGDSNKDLVDDFNEPIDLSSIFAKPKSENGPEYFKPAFDSFSEAKEEAAPVAVEGRGGMMFCPKCSFALLPGETKCSRCN